MKKIITTILWGSLYIAPLAVVYYTFKAFTLEYDEDIATFVLALGIGFITPIALGVLWIIDPQVYSERKMLLLYAKLFGTPLTPIIIYLLSWIVAIAFGFPSAK